MYSPKLWIYLGETTRYNIVTRIFAIEKTNVAPWLDWRLQDGTRLLQVTTNILYNHAMTLVSWLSPKAKKLWNVYKSNARWWNILQRGWHSHLPFHAKVFIWRVMIRGLPLGSTLKRRGLGSGTCFFCTVPLEDSTSIYIYLITFLRLHATSVYQYTSNNEV